MLKPCTTSQGKTTGTKTARLCFVWALYVFRYRKYVLRYLVVAEAAGFVQMGPRWANISDLDLCTVPSIRYPSQSLFYIYLLYNYIYIYI